jgi:hypothetical protein
VCKAASNLNRPVAINSYRHISRTIRSNRRFAAAKPCAITPSNIITIHDFGDQEAAFIVMEYLTGETISQIAARQGCLSRE